MKIYLIRHGETECNKDRKFYGHLDVPLDDNGRAQAESLGMNIKDELVKDGVEISALYSSPLTRAMSTAAPVSDALSLDIQKDAGLMEMNMGEWEGKSVDQIINIKDKDGLPLMFKCMRKPLSYPMPGGEKLQDADKRITSTLDDIISHHLPAENIACVTHGGVIAVVLCHILGKSLDDFRQNIVDNTSITVIETDSDLAHAKLVKKNDTSHLAQEGLAEKSAVSRRAHPRRARKADTSDSAKS
jgi:broad specificity phosphatase PhoE